MDATEWKSHAIRRKAHVPESDRTDGKDDVADYIEDAILADGRWPMDLKEVSEEIGCSRQHVKNTLDAYFEPVEDTGGGVGGGSAASVRADARRLTLDIDIPQDIEREDEFLRGFIQGWTRRGRE